MTNKILGNNKRGILKFVISILEWRAVNNNNNNNIQYVLTRNAWASIIQRSIFQIKHIFD